MTRKHILMIAVAGAALAMSVNAPSFAQTVAAAMDSGTVGEQSDGYLGINGSVPAAIKAEVESINIKRRAAYTDLAGKRGVTVSDMAAATGCKTLSTRVKTGQAYRIGNGPWQVKGAGAIALPDYCATAG